MVKRQATRGLGTAHAASTVFGPFQKHIVKLAISALPFKQWSEEGNGPKFLKKRIIKEHTKCNVTEAIFYEKQYILVPNRVGIFGTGVTFRSRSDVNQAVAVPSRLQLCAVLGSSGIRLYE